MKDCTAVHVHPVPKSHFITISILPILLIILGVLLDTPREIYNGIYNIIIHPDMLLVDYLAVGGIGATFVNSGLLMIVCILFVYLLKMELNGPLIAGILTVGGFAFIGKNIFNIWPIFLGGFLYTRYKHIEYKTVLLVMMFATSLSPIVTYLSFEASGASIPLGLIAGMFVGFIVPPLTSQMLKIHEGYNLYNIGFTCGILGTLIAAFLRSFGHAMETQSILSSEYSSLLRNLLIVVFIATIIVGYFYNNKSFKGYNCIFKLSGRLLTNTTELIGYGNTYINMGLMGLISIAYVILVNGVFNGPVVAGILTVVGFGAFGKHPRNSIPIMFGVFLAGIITNYELSSTGIIMAALFGTTLAPIAGGYGVIPGLIAGFLHVVMVNNTGKLHGGLNLYNNGFSGGIIAAILVPIYNAFISKKIDD